MLNVKLKIIGDPSFIKQDDIYYNPMSPEYQDYAVAGSVVSDGEETVPINATTGQIIYDQEQIFVQLIIKSAVDINDKTGITNKQIKLSNGRTTDSTFSGVYKVLKVSIDLTRGRFEQTLELVKMPNDLFFDDVSTSSPETAVKVQVAQAEEPHTTVLAVTPANQVTENTGISNNENAALKDAAAQAPINPQSNSAGEGAVVASTQPTQAAPSNANDAPQVAPQEKTPADLTNLLAQLDAQYKENADAYNKETTAFNARIRSINGDTTLTRKQKYEKILAEREKYLPVLEATYAKNQEIFKGFETSSKSVLKTGGQILKNFTTSLERVNAFSKDLRYYFTDQEVKIADLKDDLKLV
jgi:hypothetical protein